MRMIFKVSYYVRSNYENKQGKSPLMIRIFLNGEMLNVGSSGIYIDKKLWNNSTNRVKGRGSESLNLNAQLDNISNSLQMIFKKHEFDEDLTLDKIKSIFLGKNKVKTTFVEFYDKYLEDIKAQVGAGKSIALYIPEDSGFPEVKFGYQDAQILQDRSHLCPEVRRDDARPFLEPPLSPGTGGSGFSYG